MAVLILTVAAEGGFYSPRKDRTAPIRIYSDRRVQDDIYRMHGGKKWRSRLSRSEYRHARKAAAENASSGLV